MIILVALDLASASWLDRAHLPEISLSSYRGDA